jgi:hypothetical protein
MPKALHGMHGSRARGVCRVQHARFDARHPRRGHHARHARTMLAHARACKHLQQEAATSSNKKEALASMQMSLLLRLLVVVGIVMMPVEVLVVIVVAS